MKFQKQSEGEIMLPIFLGLLDLEEDKEIFTHIYTLYEQPMLKAAMEILKDRDLAQDAVQEAFLDIIRHFKKVRGLDQRHLRGYVLVVSRNRAIDICRKRKDVVYIDESIESLPITEQEDSGDSILEGIPEPYRSVLLLTGLQYTPDEIAEILGENKWTIYKRRKQGKELLRKLLNMEGNHEY